MRLLGLFFILVGLWLCFTILFAWPGAIAIALGALLVYVSRDRAEGTVTRAGARILGSLIVVSVLWAGLGFIYLAAGGKPTPRHSPVVVHDVRPPAGPLAEPSHANRHKVAR